MPISDWYMFLCTACTPSGLRIPEFDQKPVNRACEVCGGPADRWFKQRDDDQLLVLCMLRRERAEAASAQAPAESLAPAESSQSRTEEQPAPIADTSLPPTRP